MARGKGKQSGNDITIKLWVVIVLGIFSRVFPLESTLWSSHNKLLASDILSNTNAFFGSLNIWISSKVWNWIVHLECGWCSL
jgi:hypothetical protein